MLEIALEDPTHSFPRDIACRNVIVAAEIWQIPAELIDVFCAFEIYPARCCLIDCEIVNSGEMKDRSYLLTNVAKIFVRDPRVVEE